MTVEHETHLLLLSIIFGLTIHAIQTEEFKQLLHELRNVLQT